jgi:hypothetical protein
MVREWGTEDEARLKMASELNEHLRFNPQEIKDEIEKGELDYQTADDREDKVTEHARNLLLELCKIVSYSATNNPKRLEKIFDQVPKPSEAYPDAPPEELTGELALKIILMMTSSRLDDRHRDHMKQALEVGYNCNSENVQKDQGFRLQSVSLPDEKVFLECKTHLDWYMGFYNWWEK